MILCLPLVTDMCLCCIETRYNHVLWCVASPFPTPSSFCLFSLPVYASFCNPSIIQVSFCLCFFLCQVLLSRAWICGLVFPSHKLLHIGPTKWIWRIPTSQYLTLLFTATVFEVEGTVLPLEDFYNPGRMENYLVLQIFYLCFCACRCDMTSISSCSGCEWR